MSNGIVGLIEVCGSMSYKITGDAHPDSGMGKYESKDFFLSVKASCTPESIAQVTADLQAFAESCVMAKAQYHINLLKHPAQETAAPVQQPILATTTQPPPATQTGSYVVAEKQPANVSTETPQPQPTQTNGKSPSKVIAERLYALGMTTVQLTAWVKYYYQNPPADAKITQTQYVEAFTKAEEFIKQNSLQDLIDGIDGMNTSSQQPQPNEAVFSQDPATMEALKQVCAKWPLWGPELTRVATLWCADQVKDANALAAFLIAAGMTDQTPPAKIEAFLAITRHMAMSSGAQVVEYAKKSNSPFSMIEADLSKAVGKPIRFALDLQGAVADAFDSMKKGVK